MGPFFFFMIISIKWDWDFWKIFDTLSLKKNGVNFSRVKLLAAENN